MRFVKIACVLFNRYFENIEEERKERAKEMLAKVDVENLQQKEVLEKDTKNAYL